MNLKDIEEIIKEINKNGGYREKDILNNLIAIMLYMNTKEYKVYRFSSSDLTYFDYDFVNKKIVG